MNRPARAQVLIAELRIVTGARPTATLICHVCLMPPHTVRGHNAVAEYVRSQPLNEHRVTCPGRPAAATDRKAQP